MCICISLLALNSLLGNIQMNCFVHYLEVKILVLVELVTLPFCPKIPYSVHSYFTTLLDVSIFRTLLYLLTQGLVVLTCIQLFG